MSALRPMQRGSASLVPFGGDPRDGAEEPPHNTEAEQALLGALLVRNEGLADVRDTLKPSHFYEAVHGRIYEAICSLVDGGKTATPLMLRPFFEHDDGLSDVGGASYLLRLATSVVGTLNVTDYSGAIIDCAQRRELMAACQRIAAEARSPRIDRTADDLAADLAGAIDTVRGVGGQRGGLEGWDTALRAAVETAEAAWKSKGTAGAGMPTGLADLDARIGRMQGGDLIVLAGRPGAGKSALGQFLATFNAESGESAAFFSQEMTAGQLGWRDIARVTGIDYAHIRNGTVQDQQWPDIVRVASERMALPLFIDCARGLTVAQIKARCQQHRRKVGKLGLVVIDYLQLLRAEQDYRGNRTAEIEEVTKASKHLAGDLNVPVLLLCQLNRKSEGRDDKRPELSDLRGSGSIEQDADTVLLLYRQHYYPRPINIDPEVWEDSRNILEIIIGKQRHGPTGVVRINYEPGTNRFWDLAA